MMCICKGVSEERIRNAVKDGAVTFEEVQQITACSTSCGTCRPRIENLIDRELKNSRG